MVHIRRRHACKHTHADRQALLLQQPQQDVGEAWQHSNMPSLKPYLRRKKNISRREEKNKIKLKHPIFLPHPHFKQYAKSLAACTETHWSVSTMKGSLPAPDPHNEFLLKPHLRGSFRVAGQAWIWNSNWSILFSILAASPLLLALKKYE